eukprot:gene15713-17298_t
MAAKQQNNNQNDDKEKVDKPTNDPVINGLSNGQDVSETEIDDATIQEEYQAIDKELDELDSFMDNLENQSTMLHDKVKDFLDSVKATNVTKMEEN